MKKSIAAFCAGLLALVSSSVVLAATVTITSSNNSPNVGQNFTLTVSGAGFPDTVGATLKIFFDNTKVAILTPTLTNGIILAAGSPFTGGIATPETGLFPSGGNFSVLAPTVGVLPSGTFNAFQIVFQALASGSASIILFDDQADFSWTEDVTFAAVPVTYTQANVTVSSAPVTVVTAVTGSMSPTQETCLQGLTNAVSEGENCMYDGGPATGGNAPIGTEVTGPYNQIAYYDSLATPAAFTATTNPDTSRTLYAPVAGDAKLRQRLAGDVSINDNGTAGSGTDDLISFTVTLTSTGTGAIVRSYGASVVDKYDSMTQVLAPITPTSATANAGGGFDYIIGSEGFPSLLTFSQGGVCFGGVFGNVDCAHSFAVGPDPDFWNGTSAAGLGSLENSLGAKTTGTVANLACIDSRSATTDSNDCRDSQVSYSPYLGPNGACAVAGGCVVGGIRGAAEDVGWDQLLLKISTNAAGSVTAFSGYNVDEYRVFGSTRCGDNNDVGATGSYSATCNSWTSGYFTTAATARDDAVTALQGVAVTVEVLANDTGFVDPVTVTATQPANGTTTVNGGGFPANQAGIDITYQPAGGFTGTNTFTYNVVDARGASKTGTVTATVVVFGANDDTASTTRNTGISIPIGVNDSGFTPTVTATFGSCSAGGTFIIVGSGGSTAGISANYTPGSAAGSPGYTETCTYTLDDGVNPADGATVTITVSNTVPNAADGALSAIGTIGLAPLGRTGTFTAPGVGGSLGNVGGGAAVTVTTQGAKGNAVVVGNVITYTVTDAAFFAGTDSFTYLVTDADGETDSGVVTVTIANVVPVIADGTITTRKDVASAAFSPTITAGNGSPAQHQLTSAAGANGTCTVSAPGNAASTLTYTPDAGFVGTDSCLLTLTDGDGSSDTANIAINVTNIVPDAVAGAIAISTQGFVPLGRTGTFSAPGVGGSLGDPGAGSAVAVTAQGTKGNATVVGNVITYTVTDGAFFAGTDTFTYRVTDSDGETDSALVTVTIADVLPVIADLAITTEQDNASAATPLGITAGNGSAAQHTLVVTTDGQNGLCTLTAANATGQVIYEPEPGFSGTDSCLLTLTDGDADSDTATVNVTVEQAGTILIDGGSSALDPWSLAFLGGLPFLRRRRKAAAMKLAMAAAAGVLAAPVVMADDAWDWDYDGVYLGAGAIGTSLKTSSAFNSEILNGLGLSGIPSSGVFDDFPLGWQLYAGWMFTNMFGMELRWSDSGNGDSDIFLVNNAGVRTSNGDIGVSIDGFTLYGVGNWPVAERLDLFGKLGYTRQDFSLDASYSDGGGGGAPPLARSDDDVGPAAALGARWRFARHFASTVEVEYLGVDFDNKIDKPWRVGLNLEYWFGGNWIAAAAPVAVAAAVAAPPPPPPPPAAPVDSDGDGVVDGSDQCPDTPTGDRVGAAGCSCDVTRQLTFKTNSAELSDADKRVLDEMAENLTRLKFISGVIEGHTDSAGADAYNQGLSERRAQAAADYLAAKGISSDRMQIVGRGETDPVGDNTTAEGRAQNRRVVAKRTDCDK